MYKMLTKNRQGFTIVELLVVLILLSFGVLALANMFRVTFRAFQKSEERSIKQEAVKTVAEMLREGQTNVASAMSADIFATTEIISPTDADITYSYLFFEPHYACSECEADWNEENDECTEGCDDGESKVNGYFIKCQNKGQKPNEAFQLSDVPIFVTFEPMKDFETGATDAQRQDPKNKVNQCGVLITLAALEDDYVYPDKYDGNIDSDYIYYSLDVAYHFPNMVLSESGSVVNYASANLAKEARTFAKEDKEEKRAECANQAVKYTSSGKKSGSAPAVDEGGVVLRVYSDTIIAGDSANTNITTPTLCFIATASYGHDSGEVGLLCKFRDECLLTNPLGTAFVKAYYKLSPPIADFIAESEPLKAAVRIALKPLVAVATNVLNEDVAKQNVVWFALFMLCGAGATATLIKVDKRKKKAKE